MVSGWSVSSQYERMGIGSKADYGTSAFVLQDLHIVLGHDP